jgi:hypothetical protein
MSAIPPTNSTGLLVDNFILYATQHLTTIGGMANTVSVYGTTPAPGIVSWTGYTVPPASGGGGAPPPTPDIALYKKLDWSKVPLDKNDKEVQAIINPNPAFADEQLSSDPSFKTDPVGASSRVTQLNNVKAEILDKALRDQKIIKSDPKKEASDAKVIKSGYKSLDELLKIAGAWASKLGKNPRVKYENLKQGYIKGIHGLCPQGTQAVVVALTGISGLGTITGNADWFSFKNPSTGGGRSSFAIPIRGKVYYNDKVHIDSSYTLNPSKWQVGDIVVMGYTGGAPYGHIQVFTGWKWVSDFTQNIIQANHVDSTSIAMWRLNENGRAAVESNKKTV